MFAKNMFFFILAILFSNIVLSQINYTEGELEVFRYDSSAGSGYLFYLKTADNRYKIESKEQISPELIGTRVKVKGNINGNTIFADEITKVSSEASSLNTVPEPNAGKNSNSNLSQIYFAIPIVLTLLLLAYVEWHRLKGHKEVTDLKRQHLMTALRDYAVSNIKKGYKKEQIKDALIKHNYNEKDVDEVFKGL